MNNERGSVLIISLVIMVGMLLLLGGIKEPDIENNEYGFGYLQMLLSDFYETHRNYLRVMAINLAEAGIDRAMNELNSDWSTFGMEYYDVVNETIVSNYDTLTDQQRNDNSYYNVCGYSVTVTGDNSTITAIGYVKEMYANSEFRFNMSRKITINAIRPVPEALGYGVFSNLSLELKNTINIIGDCHTNDTASNALEIKSAATVTGNIQAVGTATNSGGTVTGSITSGADSIPLPTVDFDYYRDNGTTYTSIPEDASLSGIIYVDGDVEIEGDVTLNGVLVSRGKITVTAGSTLTHTKWNNEPALMSEEGDIELDGTVTLNSFIYTANTEEDKGKIELKGNVTITGSIIAAGSLEIKDTANVAITEVAQGVPSGFIVTPELTSSWKEEQLTGAEKL